MATTQLSPTATPGGRYSFGIRERDSFIMPVGRKWDEEEEFMLLMQAIVQSGLLD